MNLYYNNKLNGNILLTEANEQSYSKVATTLLFGLQISEFYGGKLDIKYFIHISYKIYEYNHMFYSTVFLYFSINAFFSSDGDTELEILYYYIPQQKVINKKPFPLSMTFDNEHVY